MKGEVKFFQTTRGKYPVQEFIEKQDMATGAKITSYVDLLVSHGPYLKPPYIKKLQDKLYELRISGKVKVRIFYTLVDNEYYLLHGFKKKSQKTPSKEIKVALDRMRELI